MKWRELFYIHKSDRQVLLVLLVLAVVIVCTIHFAGEKELVGVDENTEKLVSELEAKADSSKSWGGRKRNAFARNEPDSVKDSVQSLFYFDPNTADSIHLRKLGLSQWQVRNILKYRRRGGVYRTKENFMRVPGLTVKKYRELEPYIRISPDFYPASTLIGKNKKEITIYRDTIMFPTKLKEGETIDINTTDTTLLKSVPGIGSYYAARIVDYGRKLGGYVSVDQLDEIYSFPKVSKQYFEVTDTPTKRLKINSMEIDDMRKHPYMNFYQARAIAEYRRLHGPIHSLYDLRLLPEFPPHAIERLLPYVSCEE